MGCLGLLIAQSNWSWNNRHIHLPVSSLKIRRLKLLLLSKIQRLRKKHLPILPKHDFLKPLHSTRLFLIFLLKPKFIVLRLLTLLIQLLSIRHLRYFSSWDLRVHIWCIFLLLFEIGTIVFKFAFVLNLVEWISGLTLFEWYALHGLRILGNSYFLFVLHWWKLDSWKLWFLSWS